MKNIHILPTDQPSRLVQGKNFYFYKDGIDIIFLDEDEKFQNICITSDEEIKDGDWMIRGNEQPTLVTPNFFWDFGVRYYKIILTTDPTLIADGVQAIDDEFLEWFVKNPSCEFIEIKKQYITPLGDIVDTCYDNERLNYKIIIPQEEPKQETLEEAAERYESDRDSFEAGAKWQAERMYNEEEVKTLIDFIKDCASNWDCDEDSHRYNTPCRMCEAQKVLEQFKKK